MCSFMMEQKPGTKLCFVLPGTEGPDNAGAENSEVREAIRPDRHCPSEQHVRALVSSGLVRDLFFFSQLGNRLTG